MDNAILFSSVRLCHIIILIIVVVIILKWEHQAGQNPHRGRPQQRRWWPENPSKRWEVNRETLFTERISNFSNCLCNFWSILTSGDLPLGYPTTCRYRGVRNSAGGRRKVRRKSPESVNLLRLRTIIFTEVIEAPKFIGMGWITCWIIMEVNSNPLVVNSYRGPEELHVGSHPGRRQVQSDNLPS